MKRPFKEYLKAGAVINHSADYSGGSAAFAFLMVDSGQSYYEVDSLTFDATFGGDDLSYADFLSTGGPLTNGFTILLMNSIFEILVDLTDGRPIKTNHDLWKRASVPTEFTLMADAFNPDRRHMSLVLRFKKPLIMRAGDLLGIGMADDLDSGLGMFLHFIASGRKVEK